MRRILVGTIALGIIANVIDYVLNNYVFGAAWAALTFVNPTPPMIWLIIGDFAAALMLMVAWDKFGAAMGSGAGGGFKFGLFAGFFVNFPMTLMWSIYINGFPYSLAWKMIIVSTVWYGILGAIAGMLDKKTTTA